MNPASPSPSPSPQPDPSQDPTINPKQDPEAVDVKPSNTSTPKVSQDVVVYMGGDLGPFKCGNCEFFKAPSSCAIVAGKIMSEGCCDLFTPASMQGSQDEGEEDVSHQDDDQDQDEAVNAGGVNNGQ